MINKLMKVTQKVFNKIYKCNVLQNLKSNQ